MKLTIELRQDGLMQVSAGAERYPPALEAHFRTECSPTGQMVPIMDLSIPLGEFAAGVEPKRSVPRTLDDVEDDGS